MPLDWFGSVETPRYGATSLCCAAGSRRERQSLIYAATEAPMMQWFVDASCRTDDPRIPIGYPLRGNRLALIDEDGHDTPPGEVGELIVSSPYVKLGLWVDGHCAT